MIGTNPAKNWTLLVLLNGDSELREQVSTDLLEMDRAGAPDGVELEATLYRGELEWNLRNLKKKLTSPKYPPALRPDWRGRRTFKVGPTETVMLGQPSEEKPSDLKALKEMIVKGLKTYPARHTMVILGGHADGHLGQLIDGDGEGVSVPDLARTLEEAQQEAGRSIDVLGIEGCSSNQVSVAYELRNSADYLVASAGKLKNNGWDFEAVLNGMDAEAEPREMAQYIAAVADPEGSSALRAVDLSKLDSLAQQLARTKTPDRHGGGRFDLSQVAPELSLEETLLGATDGLSIYVPDGQPDSKFQATAFAQKMGWGQ